MNQSIQMLIGNGWSEPALPQQPHKFEPRKAGSRWRFRTYIDLVPHLAPLVDHEFVYRRWQYNVGFEAEETLGKGESTIPSDRRERRVNIPSTIIRTDSLIKYLNSSDALLYYFLQTPEIAYLRKLYIHLW